MVLHDNLNAALQSSVWNGTIPLMIELSSESIADGAQPDPLFIQASRISLWSHVLGEVFSHFGPHIPTTAFTYDFELLENTHNYSVEQRDQSPPSLSEVQVHCWLESFQGLPIDWTVPVGVTADIITHGLKNVDIHVLKPLYGAAGKGLLPLHLKAHFTPCPIALPPLKLVALSDHKRVPLPYCHVHWPSSTHHRHILHSIKQAARILYRSPVAESIDPSIINTLVAYTYQPHGSGCCSLKAQSGLCSAIGMDVPLSVVSPDYNQWRIAFYSEFDRDRSRCKAGFDKHAYEQWRRDSQKRLESMLANVASITASSPTVASSLSTDDNEGESGTRVLSASEQLLLEKAELDRVLKEEYDSGGCLVGHHMFDIPVRVYTRPTTSDANTFIGMYRCPAHINIHPKNSDVASQTPKSRASLRTVGELFERITAKREINKDFVVVSHGVELSPDTPLDWLYSHFKNPDMFLHLVVIPL